jgi:hypothetical protein
MTTSYSTNIRIPEQPVPSLRQWVWRYVQDFQTSVGSCTGERRFEDIGSAALMLGRQTGQLSKLLEHGGTTRHQFRVDWLLNCLETWETIRVFETPPSDVQEAWVQGKPGLDLPVDAGWLVLIYFAQMRAVEAIYQDDIESVVLFWIFTSNEKYDDALMDQLLSRENRILDTYPGTSIAFRYLPSAACQNHREVVGNTATLIFKRPAWQI